MTKPKKADRISDISSRIPAEGLNATTRAALIKAHQARFSISHPTAYKDLETAQEGRKPSRDTGVNQQHRIEALSSKVALGPVHVSRLLKKHAQEHGVGLSTAWSDWRLVKDLWVAASEDRISDNRAMMERVVGEQLDEGHAMFLAAAEAAKGFSRRANEAAEEDDMETAGEMWARANSAWITAGNLMRSCGVPAARLARLQGLDDVDVAAMVPVRVVREASTFPASISEGKIIDVELVDPAELAEAREEAERNR